jgi:spore germination protein GerM
MALRVLGIGCLAIAAIAWALFVVLPRSQAPRATPGAPPAAAVSTVSTVSTVSPVSPGADTTGRRIKARLFYVSDDGTRLKAVEQDVAYGDGPAAQAREIVRAQIAPAAGPLVSAVPPGTTLRALYLTPNGSAYVDLSRDVVTAHPGGSLDELLTVYSIVNALTMNLPAVTSVQVLVDGKEVDTLVGHVDLRRPLTKNVSWVE